MTTGISVHPHTQKVQVFEIYYEIYMSTALKQWNLHGVCTCQFHDSHLRVKEMNLNLGAAPALPRKVNMRVSIADHVRRLSNGNNSLLTIKPFLDCYFLPFFRVPSRRLKNSTSRILQERVCIIDIHIYIYHKVKSAKNHVSYC